MHISAIVRKDKRYARTWDICGRCETLAEQAAMSRGQFAQRFREKAGVAPLNYLTHWRISIACSMLRQGKRLKLVATPRWLLEPICVDAGFLKPNEPNAREWLQQHKLT